MTQTQSTDLDTRNYELNQALKRIQIDTKLLGAVEGEKRLELARTEFPKLTFEQTYNTINPPAIIREAEAAKTGLVRIFYVVRNALALSPLILTWVALWLASSDYQEDLFHYPNDVYLPFLKLWQENFHGKGHLTFSDTALWDVILLSLYLLTILLFPLWEWRIRHRKDMADFADKLQEVTRDLMVEVLSVGGSSAFSDEDMLRFSIMIGGVINDAVKQATDSIKGAMKEVQPILDGLKDLGTFHAVIRQLTQDLRTLNNDLQSHEKKLEEFTGATKQVAASSVALETSADKMTNSAAENAQASRAVAVAAESISGELGALNDTQQQIAGTIATTQGQVVTSINHNQKQMVQKLDDSQQNIVDQFGKATDKMTEVADDTKKVSESLRQITQVNIDQKVEAVNRLSTTTQESIDKIAGRLEKVEEQLKKTTEALAKAAERLATIPTTPPIITTAPLSQETKDDIQKIADTLNSPGVFGLIRIGKPKVKSR